jgi:hypothetical protein
MYRKFINARSPLRLLEKGLHGGLGSGNLGALVAGHGVGKTSFLVGVALDELLRGGTILHIALDQSVSHVRDYYDTVYDALALSTHLDDERATQAEIDGRRRIRAYRADTFSAVKLADAIKIESEAGARPTMILIDGLPSENAAERDELAGIRSLAQELSAEVWFTMLNDESPIHGLPDALATSADLVSVVLAMESLGKEVTLRAVKDHENEELHNLHVGLDPQTLLLVRA